MENIVQININYTYEVLMNDIAKLKKVYQFLEIGIIGQSVLKKQIPYIKIGNGKKQVLYNAAIHANEWITSPVLMKFIEEYSKAILKNENIYGYNARQLYKTTSLYIVPMLNPDGVDLVTLPAENNNKINKDVIKIANNFPNIPFPSGWKANINGVDFKNLQLFIIIFIS